MEHTIMDDTSRAEVSGKAWGDITQADYTMEQWARACLIHMVDDPTTKDQCKLPVKEPDGTLNRNAVHAAASVLAGGRGGVDAPPGKIAAAKAKIRSLYAELEEDVPDSLKERSQPVLESVDEPDPNPTVRSDAVEDAAIGEGDENITGVDGDGWFIRSYALEDIQVTRADNSGRTVEAYAAVFDHPTEVRDKDGHYREIIDQKAFNRAISRPPFSPLVIYNHGLDLFGRPAQGASTVPLGESLEIKADKRGVFTRARYHNGAFADEVLQAIKDGVITGQSFRGSFTRSKPSLRPGKTFGRRDGQELVTVRREEVFPLVEFGPTPTPVYKDAAIMAVRSERLRTLAGLLQTIPADDDDVAEALGEEAGRSAPSRTALTFQRVRADARRRRLL